MFDIIIGIELTIDSLKKRSHLFNLEFFLSESTVCLPVRFEFLGFLQLDPAHCFGCYLGISSFWLLLSTGSLPSCNFNLSLRPNAVDSLISRLSPTTLLKQISVSFPLFFSVYSLEFSSLVFNSIFAFQYLDLQLPPLCCLVVTASR